MANICEKCTHRNVCRYQEPCEECNQFAEEVVRCKDCKHWKDEGFDSAGKCELWNIVFEYDYFCADGERKC